MGYYVDILNSDLVIPEKNQAEILKRWKNLNNPKNNHLKQGGSWSGGKQAQAWFSWMPADYDKTAQNIETILELMGFAYEKQDNGNIKVTGYDSKTGQEKLFFDTIEDLIPAGKTVEWHGEDGTLFNWFFDGKKLHEVSPTQSRKLAETVQIEKSDNLIDPFNKTPHRRYRL